MRIERAIWIVVLLFLVQSFALIYFANGFYKLNEIILSSAQADKPVEASQVPHQSVSSNSQNYATSNIDEATIRRAVQQELSQYFSQHSKITPVVKKSKNHISDPDHLERVEEQLGVMIAEGDLSAKSIDNYSFAVAKLAPDDRSEALSRLAKAVNSGLLKKVN